MIMPVDDEFEAQFDQHKQQQQQHGMSKAEQRRSNKPIMEKRRRARINHCLNELKALILDAMKKDPARHSKLEKADILEMTVKHLQSIQRQQLAVAVATDPSVLHKFKTGFNECAGEVSRYISSLEGVDVTVKQRLVNHLANCVNGLQQLSPFAFGTSGLPQDLNNNQRGQHLQLIPSRLPTGELALLLPNTSSMPFFPSVVPSSTVTSATMDRTHPSAFTAVNRNDLPNTSRSPPPSPTSSTSSDDTEPPDHQGGGVLQNAFPGFKVPLTSPTGYGKPSSLSAASSSLSFRPAEQMSPQQHSVVSSTCPPPDSATSAAHAQQQQQQHTFAQVKLEFKTMPIDVTAQQPLTVVTSPVYEIPTIGDHLQVKNPLDFSMRKDVNINNNSSSNNNNNNNNRQCASTQTSTVVLGTKRQFPGSSSSELITSSLGSPNKMARYSFSVVEGEEERQVTTSSGRPSSSTSVADPNDMWRPW